LDKKTVLRLRVTAQKLKPTLHIGKDGVSDMVLEEIVRQLKKSKLIKVRVLNSLEGDRKEIGSGIARSTSSVLVDVRGSTIVLAKDENGQI
jgi:RNA-binding protein